MFLRCIRFKMNVDPVLWLRQKSTIAGWVGMKFDCDIRDQQRVNVIGLCVLL